VVNWSALPDLGAVGLLAAAFASVARRSQTQMSRVWLIGWMMIALHFVASLLQNVPSIWGTLVQIVGASALTWAGLLFMWASVPYRGEKSSRRIFLSLILANTLYLGLAISKPELRWAFTPAAILFGALPLIVALTSQRRVRHRLRWYLVTLYGGLSAFLLVLQGRPVFNVMIAENAVLFTVYLGCCIHFYYAYRRGTAGAFITIAGFMAWASVFVLGPLIMTFWPHISVQSEVWNLPKYLVAVGMILLLLEDQIDHNKHLALHDHLTGLPNRRLYLDRLSSALERARRAETSAAVLVIDLDRFKQVNDTLGHHMGDLVLQRVAAIFSSRVRRSDTVARTGGDEFSVILEEPTTFKDASLVGRSLIKLLDAPIDFGDRTVQIGASVGVAIFPEDAQDSEALGIVADLRMYDAKHELEQERVEAAHSEPAMRPKTEQSPYAGI
jgi:diguanylate cyclase (GGDEF)-like protein